MKDLWRKYQSDFNSMTDDEVDQQEQEAQAKIDEEQDWVDAVASWKAAGKPRSTDS